LENERLPTYFQKSETIPRRSPRQVGVALRFLTASTTHQRGGEGSPDSGIAPDDDDPASFLHFSGGCLNTDEGGTDVDGHHAVAALEAELLALTP
jgi:hypothetical protein